MDYFQLSEWRKRLGLSLSKMARYLGTNENTYVKWEYGERSPSQAAQRLFSVLQHVELTCPKLHRTALNGALPDALPPIHSAHRLRPIQKEADTEATGAGEDQQGRDFEADRPATDR